jgi:acyl carrier protein
MNKEEIIEKLNIVKPYTSNEQAYENFTEDTDFITDLNINSANLVDIILDVKMHFKFILIMNQWKK